MHAPAPRPTTRFTPRAWLGFAAITLIWGSTWIVIKTQLASPVPPPWSVAYRFALAGTLLLALCIATRRPLRLGARGHAFALLAGVFQFALNFNLVYHAEQFVASGLIALLFALLVVPNALFGWIFLRQPVTLKFAAGAAMGIGGVALLFAHDLAAPAAGGALFAGLVFGSLGVLSASIANVMQASPTARSLPKEATLAMSMLYGAAINIGFALWRTGPPVFDTSPLYIAGLLYLAVMASAVAFTLYFALIREVGPATAAYSGVLVPVLALALSTLLEGYRWPVQNALGAALALAGLVVALRGRD